MTAKLEAKDFATSQEVRWCPGCGDYAILKVVTKILAEVGATRESTVFVSGIGCSSRFPYYIESYGFHTIHGRAPAVATGLKLTNPELDVWVVTGDGDGLSIGGNHLLHAIRRNVGLNILLFNNEIYGLTKGQYSPTSKVGTRSPSSPRGSIENPVSPGEFVLGAGGRFFARGIDTDKAGLGAVLKEAYSYNGTAMVEIYQNCIVYNDNVFDSFTTRATAKDTQLHLKHGEPMLFGQNNEKGLSFNNQKMALEVVDADDHSDDVLIHDEANRIIAQLLISMSQPEFPVALGVIHRKDSVAFKDAFYAQRENGLNRTVSVNEVLRRTNTWTVT
jgi:2-oxoglutarate ferredoxin oxidoreductase subunit beta